MRWTIAALTALGCACADSPTVPFVPASTTRSIVILESSNDGALARASGHSVSSLLRVEPREDHALAILEYDAPLESLGLVVHPDSTIELALSTEPSAVAWRMLTPDRHFAFDGEAGRFEARDPRDPALEAITVRRPPCPILSEYRPLRAPHDERGVSTAVVFGDHALVGYGSLESVEPRPDAGPRLYLFDLRNGEAVELSGRPETPIGSSAQPNPRAFLDEDRAYVTWYTESSSDTHSLIPVTADGALGAPIAVTIDPALGNIHIPVAGRFGGERTLVAFTMEGSFVRFDEIGLRWELIEPAGPMSSCVGHTPRFILELDGPGRGWAGLRLDAVVRFDLSRPPGARIQRNSVLLPGSPFCRNQRARVDTGLDVVVYSLESGLLHPVELAWRRPDTDWERALNNDLLAQAIVDVEGGFVVSGASDTAIYFQHDASRPELPPRQCGSRATNGSAVYHLARTGPRTVLVAGTRGAGLIEILP